MIPPVLIGISSLSKAFVLYISEINVCRLSMPYLRVELLDKMSRLSFEKHFSSQTNKVRCVQNQIQKTFQPVSPYQLGLCSSSVAGISKRFKGRKYISSFESQAVRFSWKLIQNTRSRSHITTRLSFFHRELLCSFSYKAIPFVFSVSTAQFTCLAMNWDYRDYWHQIFDALTASESSYYTMLLVLINRALLVSLIDKPDQ